MARIISLTILVTLIVVLGITFFQVIAPFLLPLFLAAVVSIISQPLYRYLVRRTGNRPRVAAGLTTVGVILIVLVPLLVGTFIAAVQLFSLAEEKRDQWRERIQDIREDLQIDHLAEILVPYIYGEDPEETADASLDATAADAPQPAVTEGEPAAALEAAGGEASDSDSAEAAISERNLNRVNQLQADLEANLSAGLRGLSARTLGFAGAAAPSILVSLVGGLISAIMFVIALYYFLADGPVLLAAAQQLIPVAADYQRELLQKFDAVVRAIVLGTFMASIGQALIIASALTVCGFGNFFFVIFIIATFTSLIPLMGVWVVWVPFAIYFAREGEWGYVLFLVVVGGGVAGTIDNIIRTYVLHTDAKLHPLLAFVCILGGLRAMGLWGVFVGPIVASCLHALVKIFNIELKEFSRSKFGGSARGAVAGESPGFEESDDLPAASPTAGREEPSAEKFVHPAGQASTSKKGRKSRRMRAASRRKKQ